MTYQLCPKCSGQGVQSRPPGIPADQESWVSTSTGPYECTICKGAGLILAPTPKRAEDRLPPPWIWDTSPWGTL